MPLTSLRNFFPGRVQREILQALSRGLGIPYVAESLGIPCKEVRRVLLDMSLRVDRCNGEDRRDDGFECKRP